MSLFSSIRMAANTLQADQIALHVIGQNISNANTPGYIREETILTPAPSYRRGGVILGLGVQVDAVVQKIDTFLEERLRGSVSDKASAETKESTYSELESLVGEMTDTDVSTAMTKFFNSISEVLNQPEDVSIRNMAVLDGATLTQQIRDLASRVADIRSDVNDRVIAMADDANRLIEEIRSLNVKIAETEGGSVSKSDAVGLRDQRLMALENLAKLMDIQVKEQTNGTVTVYAGGDYLVNAGLSKSIEVKLTADRGLKVGNLAIAETDALLHPSGGDLQGLVSSRDDVLGGFLDKLDDFASTLSFEFNKVYSSGQGLKGYDELTSQSYVLNPDSPLNAAGLAHAPTNGVFQVLVYDKEAKLTHTTNVKVNLSGIRTDPQTTLNSLASTLNSIDGLSAEVTGDGRLKLRSESAINAFSFANDTSGVLAALGLNTFFTGSSAKDIDINRVVAGDPATFAASEGGIGADTKNAAKLANFLDNPIDSKYGASISVLYDRLVADTTQGATVAKASAEAARTYEATLRGQRTSVSGVNIDEEVVDMLSYQHSYQATARFISTLSELLQMLTQL